MTQRLSVDWSEVDRLFDDLAGWIAEKACREEPVVTVLDAGECLQRVPPAAQKKAEAALSALWALNAFRARRERTKTGDVESIRKAKSVQGHDLSTADAVRLLPFLDSSDYEALRSEVEEGLHWLGRLSRKLDRYEQGVQARKRIAPASIDTKSGAIERLRNLLAALHPELEGFQHHAADGAAALFCPLTNRGQTTLQNELRKKLRAAGFKPSELPMVLKKRKY